jgi:hypothetical protein
MIAAAPLAVGLIAALLIVPRYRAQWQRQQSVGAAPLSETA